AEQVTPPTGQEILVIVAHAPGLRSGFRCNIRFRHGPSPIWRCPNTALAADKAARRCDMTRLALKYGWHSARPNPHKYAAALLRESCTYRAVSPMIAFATILGRDQPVREGFCIHDAVPRPGVLECRPAGRRSAGRRGHPDRVERLPLARRARHAAQGRIAPNPSAHVARLDPVRQG